MKAFLDKLEIVLTWFFSLTFAALLIYGGLRYKHHLDEEADPWLQARKKNTAESYLAFLRGCRGCLEERAAKKALDDLQIQSGMIARLSEDHLAERAGITLPVFSPDGKQVLGTGGNGPDFWNADSGQRESHGDNTFIKQGGKKMVYALDFAPDGRRIAAGMEGREGGRLMVWDLTTEALVADHDIEAADVRGILFSPDGEWLAWRGDGPVGLWNPVTRQLLRASQEGVTSIAFGKDQTGRLNFLSAAGRDISVWEPTSMELLRELHIDSDRPLLGLSRDGQIVVYADDRVLEVYDPLTTRQLASLRDLHGEVTTFCRDAASGRLAVGTAQGLIYLWDPVASPLPLGHVAAHEGPVEVLACGTGDRVVSTGWDGAKVWNLSKLKGRTAAPVGH